MKTLLRLDASARTNDSHTRQLGDYFLTQWRQAHPQGEIIQRDLAENPVPHLSDANIQAFQQAGRQPSPEAECSDTLIGELQAADELLICSPLYNFTLPSTLKAYFDHVVRSGLTFDVRQGQYVGLLTGKCATIITARGSLSSATVADDFQTGYLVKILAFIGIHNVDIIPIEGTTLEATEVSRCTAAAKQCVDEVFNPPAESVWKGQFTAQEKQAINSLRDGQARAIVNGDANAYAQLCMDNIQLMIPGHDIISGREQFLLAEQQLFNKASFTAFSKYPQQILRDGDMVVETGLQEVTTDQASGAGGVFSARQKYMHTYRLTAAGWRYAVLMSNDCG